MTTVTTARQVLDAAASLFNTFAWHHFIPAFILVVLMWMFTTVLRQAQGRNDFDAAQFFQDDRGKLSFARVGTAVALVVSSWGYAVRMLSGAITLYEQMLYLGVWSGSGTVLIALDVWRSVRTAGAPPPQPPQPPGGATP